MLRTMAATFAISIESANLIFLHGKDVDDQLESIFQGKRMKIVVDSGLQELKDVQTCPLLGFTDNGAKSFVSILRGSTVVIGRHMDCPTAELCNTFIAPSKILPSFSSPTDFCEPLGVLNPEGYATSSSHCLAVGGGAAIPSSNSSTFGSSSFCSKFLSRNSRRKSLSSTPSAGSSGCPLSAFQTSFTPISPTSSGLIFGSRFFGSLLGGSGNSGNGNSSYNAGTSVAVGSQQQSHKPQRRLFIMRHAERVDICFGRAWTTRCIDRRVLGLVMLHPWASKVSWISVVDAIRLYHRLNLNMPPRLPVREDIIDHTLDSPLTQVGLFVAGACGRALAESGVRFSACYVSPALRCVQTACHLLKAAGQIYGSVCEQALVEKLYTFFLFLVD
ncbi:hypothetical protein ACTXT7_011615 [Hymenolepis weldensis]